MKIVLADDHALMRKGIRAVLAALPGVDVVAEALRRAATGGHLGLLGMRERVEALGGRLEIESAPGLGAEIRASIPLAAEEAA